MNRNHAVSVGLLRRAEPSGTTDEDDPPYAVLIEALDPATVSAIRALLPRRARLTVVANLTPAGGMLASGLSARQRDILALVAEGLSNKAIGRQLAISHFTVRNHLAQLMRALNVSNRQALAEWCRAGPAAGFRPG